MDAGTLSTVNQKRTYLSLSRDVYLTLRFTLLHRVRNARAYDRQALEQL